MKTIKLPARLKAWPTTPKARTIALLACIMLGTHFSAEAQLLVTEFNVPAENLINEEVCFSMTLENSGPVGYQPYVRVFLPPELESASFKAKFLGNPTFNWTEAGTFSGSTLDDPNLPEESPDNMVTGIDGYKLMIVNLPVGSMVEDGVQLSVEFCAELNGQGVQVGQPVDISAQAVYRYGDTPTGDNGAIVDGILSGSVTPVLYRLTKAVDKSHHPTGDCWPQEYSLKVDIADLQTVSDLTITDALPPDLQYMSTLFVTPGCVVTQQPSAVSPGGNLSVNCANAIGTIDTEDVEVVFAAYMTDQLDPFACDSVEFVNSGSVVSNEADPVNAEVAAFGYHFLATTESGGEAAPGVNAPVAVEFMVSQFVESVEELYVTATIPDGLTYVGAPLFNGLPITPDVVTGPVAGVTTLEFDLVAHYGSNFMPCDVGILQFIVEMNETYDDGSAVLSRDVLTVENSLEYSLENGVQDCNTPVEASFSVQSVTVEKEIISSPDNGVGYVPGEVVTYRLTMNVPSEDIHDVVFEDLFPIPIHDVTTLDLTFGNDITHSPIDNQGITPASIYIDASKNRLFIEWGSLESPTTGIPSVISVDIGIEIATDPFANGLTHSNFARFYSNNSLLDNSISLDLSSIEVGAPQLTIFKGVADTDNPDESLIPIQVPVNANASGVDAWDWLTFNISLSNIGDAPAYDVIVTDLPPVGKLGSCSVSSVETAGGDSLTYTGNLFTTGLVIDYIAEDGAADDADVAIIEYLCQIQGGIEARSNFTNTGTASWAASAGNPNRYDPITDVAQIFIAEPQVVKQVLDVTPGYAEAGKVHVGEVVTYQVEITVPEGVTRNAVFEDLLDEGMAFQELVSLTKPIDVTFAAGSNSFVFNNATIANEGAGAVNEFRKATFTFGDINNAAADNLEDELIVIVYRATVLNSENNQNGTLLSNRARLYYTNPVSGATTYTSDELELELVEPELEITASFFNEQLVPGQQTFVTLTIEHGPNSTASAYDVEIVNDLPLGLTFIDDSFILECEDLLAEDPFESFGSVQGRWDSIPVGLTCELVFSVEVAESYPACSFIDNCADVQWSSAWNTHMDTLSYAPLSSLGAERTGDITDIGGVFNDHDGDDCHTLEVVSSNIVTPVISGSNEVCNGSTITLEIPEYEGFGVNYVWSGPGVPPGFNGHELVIDEVSFGDAGSYAVYVEIGDCTTDEAIPVELSVHEVPVVDLDDIDIPCTNGSEDVQLIPQITGGLAPFDYDWAGPNSYISTEPIATVPNVGVDDEGVYTLAVTDDHGCVSNVANSTLAVTGAPDTPIVANTDDLCEGQLLELSCTPYTGTVTYHWITPTGEFETAAASLAIPDATDLDAGNYSVWVDVNDCETSVSAEQFIEVTATPSAPVIDVNANEFCEGDALVLGTTTMSDEYHWTGPNGFESFIASPSIIADITLFDAGDYHLTVSNNGCESPATTETITVLERPEPFDIETNSPICEGEELVITANGIAAEYYWTTPSGDVLVTDVAQLNIQDVEGIDAGSYWLSILFGACTSLPSNVVEVQVDIVPAEQAFAGEDMYACEGMPVEIEAGNDDDLEGYWTSDNAEIEIVSPGSFSTTVLGTESGETYEITWNLSNEGCGTYSSDVMYVVAPRIPEAVVDEYWIGQGEEAEFFVLANDVYNNLQVEVTIEEQPNHGSAEADFNELVEFKGDDDFWGDDEFVYELCLHECPNMCDTALVILHIKPYLEIPDVITPNGDGVNDVLVITGLENFPENELWIYNRWGHEVFKATNYDNNWDGKYQNGPLPEGTYFYVFIETGTSDPAAQGYITLHR
jgi:gliding motility-associated-like protein/fimbrial isopeptide formation D2 family protein/uncharacterized repeat protein (TIGR01451 family)